MTQIALPTTVTPENFQKVAPLLIQHLLQTDGGYTDGIDAIQSWRWDGKSFTGRLSLPLPREGTETRILNFNSRNINGILSLPLPREGTETCKRPEHIQKHELVLSLPLPRKGTETCAICTDLGCIGSDFHYLFPARGLKP